MEWLGKIFKKEKKEKTEPDDKVRSSVITATALPQETEKKAPAQAESLQQVVETPQPAAETSDSKAQPEDDVTEVQQAEAGPAEKDEVTVLSIKDVLKKLLMTEGVTGAMVVSGDGFLLAHSGYTGSDFEAVGVLASSQVGAAASLSEELQTGRLNQMVVDFNERRVIMESIGEGLILVLVASRESNLGMLRLVINNIKESILLSLTQA
ncbi:MAG: roadblock/LC7 domain-containing protein [Candidatus Xenobiia bacterium LiM19]